jgi:hypothetical protein
MEVVSDLEIFLFDQNMSIEGVQHLCQFNDSWEWFPDLINDVLLFYTSGRKLIVCACSVLIMLLKTEQFCVMFLYSISKCDEILAYDRYCDWIVS